jgi:tetratricopeptide (TPR) repeat protein
MSLPVKQILFSHIEVYNSRKRNLHRQTPRSPHVELKEKPDIPLGIIANFLLNCGYYNDYHLLCEWLVEMKQGTLGPSHEQTLSAMLNLAAAYSEKGTYPKAEALCWEVLEKRKELQGTNSQQTLATMRYLAWTLFLQAKLEEAEVHARRAEIGTMNLLGADHFDTLDSLTRLASIILEQGKLDESETIYRKVLAE